MADCWIEKDNKWMPGSGDKILNTSILTEERMRSRWTGRRLSTMFRTPRHSRKRLMNSENKVDPVGNILKPNYLSAQFPRFLERHGLRRIRFHDLRHSCASLLLANGVPLKSIQEWLGHSDFSTTANVYSCVVDRAWKWPCSPQPELQHKLGRFENGGK